ncbi:MAG: anthranilate phosphoribosyltransferase [Candidatus Omnitrophica bacterium]|nr:anthranilate phosphoribosyltransferase [Candidatus Omnitrophota bacterium]
MIQKAIEKAVKNIDLNENEMRAAFEEIMSGLAAHVDIVSFLKALKAKGETIDEITGAAKVMREKSVRIDAGEGLVDTCGTGGSGLDTFNISTTAAFVSAGAGIKIAKHGNRSASSQCGSADVLEALGVNLKAGPDIVEKCIKEIGIGFLFAPLFHGAMKHAVAPRREIGTRTIFNILGPLSNPANASSQVLGVYVESLTEVMANVLKKLGSRRALVVHGMDGLDEITITGKTKVTELNKGKIRTYYISPEEFGLKKAKLEDIRGEDIKKSAYILLSILKGAKGAPRDVVLLNAAAALLAASRANDFKDGIRLAEDSIDSGRALEKLERLIAITNG